MSIAKREFQEVANALGNLEKYAVTLEEKCEAQTEQLQQLTKVFGNACDEVAALKKRLSKVEKENQELRHQVLELQNENGNGIRDVSPFASTKRHRLLEYDNPGKDPMTVFPEEIWSMIFGYLKDPKDLKSCYYTCTKFQPLLQHERKIFLYSDVLTVLTAGGYLLPPRKTKSTLRISRLVCSGWKKGVDQFLEQDNQKLFHHPANRKVRTALTLGFTSSRNPWRRDPVLRNMSPVTNPMVGHYLIFRDSRKQFRCDLTQFLEKFGAHVWFFDFEMDTYDSGKICTSWYPFLVRCLNLMPNLKALSMSLPACTFSTRSNYFSDIEEDLRNEPAVKRIAVREMMYSPGPRNCDCCDDNYYYYGMDNDENDDDYSENDGQGEPDYISVNSSFDGDDSGTYCNEDRFFTEMNLRKLSFLRQEISENGFPTLKCLKTLVIHGKSQSLVMKSALTANPQIEKLYMKICKNTTSDVYAVKLDNLKELIFKGSFASFGGDLEKCAWRFRKLTLDEVDSSRMEVFKSLQQHCGDTLVELRMKLVGESDTNFPRLFLTNLKILDVKMGNVLESLDFLLPLVNLEYLTVTLVLRHVRQVDETDNSDKSLLDDDLKKPIINVQHFLHNLEESNIWQLLPKLKKVMIHKNDNEYNDYDYDISTTKSLTWKVCTRSQVAIYKADV